MTGVRAQDWDELVHLMSFYVPSAYARQMLGDWERSVATDRSPGLRDMMRQMRAALDRSTSGPSGLSYRITKKRSDEQ